MLTRNIEKETARDIALAYREVETARDLLSEITEAIERREAPDFRDAFGRRQSGLELGVPSSATSRRLFNVPWQLARPIIEAHIAQQEAIIAALSQKATMEMGGERVQRHELAADAARHQTALLRECADTFEALADGDDDPAARMAERIRRALGAEGGDS